MPLPPPTVRGGASAAPFTRNEDIYAWEFDEGDFEVFEDFEGSESEGGAGVGRSPRSMSGMRRASVRRGGESSGDEEEHELVRKGQAFNKHGLPPRLKAVFKRTIAERETFDSKQEFMMHLKRNIQAERNWSRKMAAKAVAEREARRGEQKVAEERKERRKEKVAKFQRRHGYTPGAFPDLPKFRMPKDADLGRRLEKLDKVCLGKIEQQAKVARRANREKERERRELLSISSDLTDLSTGTPAQHSLSSRPGSHQACSASGQAPAQRLPTMPIHGSNSMAAVVGGASSRDMLAFGPSSRLLGPQHATRSPSPIFSNSTDSFDRRHSRGEDGPSNVGHRTSLVEERKNDENADWRTLVAQDPNDVNGNSTVWNALFNRKPRDRENPEESILPLLDEKPLQRFVKQHAAYRSQKKDWRALIKKHIKGRIMAQRLGDIKALRDLMRNSPLEKRKEVTKSRLTVAEQFMYIHLDQLRAENDRTGKITMEQIETAKRVATVIRDEAIFGKDDPRFDRIEKNLARQHSFRWREALAADEISAPPLAAVDLWGLLQLLAVQFEPGSPGRAPRGADKADGQLDRLEREARRIEGLFSAQTQAHSGLDIGDSDAKAFVKHTEGELRKLETKYGRGLLAGPDNNTPLSPVRPKSSRPTALLFGLGNTTDAKTEDDIPYANSNTQLSYGAHEEVYLNHANLSVYELSAAVILLSQPNVRRTVRRLCLARNMLDDTQFCLLLDGLDGTAGLEHLDVSFNRLRHHSAIALAQQLARKRCPQLLELNMGNNRLGDRGAAALMDAVANTGNHIASLSLGAIEVGDRCGERLSECLTTSYYLKHVDFSFNCLGTRGGVAVAEALRTNGRLVRLDFRGCSLGDEGGEALISGLSDAEDLRRIDLSTNRLGARSVAALCSVLEANPLPKLAVFIGDNPLGRHAGSQLIRLSTSSLVSSVNMANADLHDTHTPTIGAKAKPNPSTSAALSTSPQPPILPSNLPLMAGSEVAFDATSTHSIYRLNLKFPGNVEVLRELLRRWRKDGRKSWASCHLNGAAVRMNDTLWAAWTAELDARASSDAGGAVVGSATATIAKTQKSTRSLAVAVPTAPATAPPVDLDPKSAEGEKPQLPPDAEILVEFQTHNVRCPEGQAPVGVDYLRAALREVDLQTTSDEWLMTFICALPSDVYLSAQQAVELLRCFTWSREKVSAAAVLFSRLVDPAAFDVVVRPVLGADEAHKVDEAVGLLERVDARNLTRHYHLDMSLSVDKLVAARLLGCWLAEVDAGVCKVAKAFACWRNLRVDGETVDTMEIDPATFRLPDRAILDFDFVSYVECGTTPLLRSDLMRSAQLLERQAANPQLTDAMAAVLATALVTEHIRNAEAIVDDMGAATPAFGSNGGGASSGGGGASAQYNRLEAEVERLGRKLDDAKLAEAPKAEIKEKKARLASAKKRFARLWHTGLMIKMTAAALSRVSDPDFDFDTMPHGEDPTLIPEVRSAEAANRKKSKKKGGKKRGKRGEEEVDVTRLLKVKTRNLDSALRLIRRFAGSYSLTSAQVDLLAALFDDPEHKAEVVVSCYQSIVDLRAPQFARLLHVLPVEAQVELCRRLGWCNTVRMSFPCLHYRLNLALRHDRTKLENLLFLNCELSLNLGSKDYTTDEHNVCCVRNLRVNDTVVEGPIPHNALFSHLVRRGRAVEGRALAILDFKATMAALNRVATEEM